MVNMGMQGMMEMRRERKEGKEHVTSYEALGPMNKLGIFFLSILGSCGKTR